MDCDVCRVAVSARLDGEDAGVDLVAVHTHLTDCAACRDAEWAAAALRSWLETARVEGPPADLAEAILARRAATTGPVPISTRRRSARPVRLLVAAGLVIAVGAAAVVVGAHSDTERTATVALTAKRGRFDHNRIGVKRENRVVIEFRNDDPAAVHNLSVYSRPNGTRPLVVGTPLADGHEQEYVVSVSTGRTYYYRCDIHPYAMKGVIRIG